MIKETFENNFDSFVDIVWRHSGLKMKKKSSKNNNVYDMSA